MPRHTNHPSPLWVEGLGEGPVLANAVTMLKPGTQLGSYEIVEPIGKGGMGEVYRARDTKLGCDVALKILPEGFSQDPSRLDRFEREAKLLAALSHPNVATLYVYEEADGQQYLVMELVDGETLADRIARGPIPIDDVLPLFIQIAEGLEAAHAKGIIHRDLKPPNIKITPDGKIKILDFGLAKAFSTDEDPSAEMSQSPTLTRGTAMGVILGTAPYMSPEQARGKPIDTRTDVWAFGCCLYEALTGRPAFVGDTESDTITGILERQPDWDAMPSNVSSGLRVLMRRALEKDPRRRLHHVGDARLELEDASIPDDTFTEPKAPADRSQRRARGFWATVVLSALVGGVVSWSVFVLRDEPSTSTPIHLEANLPEGYRMGELGGSLAISRDGAQLAFRVQRGNEPSKLFLRSLGGNEARVVDGSDGAWNPFFSPDGQWIEFQAGGSIFKSSTTGGGRPQRICEAGREILGAVWLDDDTILFGGGRYKGLFRVAAGGGSPLELTRPSAENGRFTDGLPEPLPDGEHVLFTTETGSSIAVLSLRTREARLLIDGGSGARYIPTGHLVYAQYGRVSSSTSLIAVRFDAERLAPSGPAIPVTTGVYTYAAVRFELPQFSMSANGALVFVPAGEAVQSLLTASLVWVERDGEQRAFDIEHEGYAHPRLAPDGKRLAVSHRYDVWIIDLERGARTRLTLNQASFQPVWTPDGRRLAFVDDGNVSWRSADGSDEPQPLVPRGHLQHSGSWSPDGRLYAYHQHHPTTGRDLWTVSPESGSEPTSLLITDFNEATPAFSPDGRWIAYISDESGRWEVYVRSYPGGETKLTISTEGGREPAWSSDGRELYYRNGPQMLAVGVTDEDGLQASEPTVLFEGDFWIQPGFLVRNYEVAPDGRFLMVKQDGPSEGPTRVNVVLNWHEELERLVPRK